MVEQMSGWVNGTLIGPDGYFAPAVFESSLVLDQTPLQGSFVLSMIDGSSRPARFSRTRHCSAYNELIRVVRRVSADEPACWFYGTDSDNALSVLSWAHRCHYDHALDYRLESFETEPAQEGGCSWLGLAKAGGGCCCTSTTRATRSPSPSTGRRSSAGRSPPGWEQRSPQYHQRVRLADV